MTLQNRILLPFLTMVLFVSAPGFCAEESHKELTGVVSKILVKATPQEVFSAIRSYRHCDASKRSVIEEKKGTAVIKEKFAGLPILGDVDCTYEETETPYSRVEYQMVDSNKLKIFEGNWTITPTEDGKASLVRLTSYVDSSVDVPAKEFLTHLSAHQDIHKRLAYVKKIAEEEQVESTRKEKKES